MTQMLFLISVIRGCCGGDLDNGWFWSPRVWPKPLQWFFGWYPKFYSDLPSSYSVPCVYLNHNAYEMEKSYFYSANISLSGKLFCTNLPFKGNLVLWTILFGDFIQKSPGMLGENARFANILGYWSSITRDSVRGEFRKEKWKDQLEKPKLYWC